MSRVKNRKGRSKVRVGEAASRVGEQVYHTGQGQDERAEASRPHPRARWPQHGLDSAWSWEVNPHRESGTRCRAAADVGVARTSAGTTDGRQSRRDGNRLGDSVGAQTPGAGEEPRSAERPHRGAMGRHGRDSGGVWPGRMRKPRCFKGRSLIAGLADPHAIDTTHPDVGQGADRHTVGLALRPLALVILPCPPLLQRRSPGELVQGVAQWLHAGKTFVRLRVIAALERDWRGPGQALNTAGIGITRSILAPFGKPPRSQALASTGERTPDLLVFMGQKKGADLLIVGGDILDHDQQLFDQRQHQARLGTHRDGACHQLGAMQLLDDLGGNSRWARMLPLSQRRGDLFQRGRLSCLGRRVGLQKDEGGALLQFGKQGKRSRIVLASGRLSTGSPGGFGSGSTRPDRASVFSARPR
jgi:hypothetical protein